jgi:hypothetical protein
MHRRLLIAHDAAGGRVACARPLTADRWWRAGGCRVACRPGPVGYAPTEAEARAHRRQSLLRVLATLALFWAGLAALIAILAVFVPS